MFLRLRLIGQAVLIMVVLSYSASCTKMDVEGKAAPDFTVEKFSGGKVSLSEFKGRPVILYWFASW